MADEHDDDMELEVNEGLTGETEHYAVVAEDVEEREADAAAVDRMREMRNNLQEAEGDEVDDG